MSGQSIRFLELGTKVKIKFKSGLVKILNIGSTAPSIFWATDEHGEYRVYKTADIDQVESAAQMSAA